jgi:hypothetical protein
MCTRLAIKIIAAGLFAAVVGCAQTGQGHRPTGPHQAQAAAATMPVDGSQTDAGDRQLPTPVMLFDRFPQLLPAQAFATRSDWPSAPGSVEATEVTYYREWSFDHFGSRHGSGDFGHLHRTFETYRVGAQYR